MKEIDRQLGTAVLRQLLLNASIGGVRFGPLLQLLVDDHRPERRSRSRPLGQTYINLESPWAVFPTRPDRLPSRSDDFPVLDEDEQLRVLCSIRFHEIADVELGDLYPHLILTLASGRLFILCGQHDRYESWQCGVAHGSREEYWLIVATPGGGLAIWAPEHFTA
jgi:hypothetical protein